CTAARDEELNDRIRAVADTFDPNRATEEQTGWPRLAQILGETVVKKVTEWLAIPSNPRTTGPVSRPVRLLPESKPFPFELLPITVREYCEEAAAALGCDPAFVALPVIAELGGAIGFTRVLQLKKTWREPCIFWTAVVAESGTLKSPAHALGV